MSLHYFSKILFIEIIISILYLTSCSETPKEEKKEIKFDSLIYDDSGNLFTGTKKGIVDGKKIEYVVVDGIKNGSFKVYHKNGKLEMEGEILKNKNHGFWNYYYSDGTLESKGNFVNDLADGKWFWYYPSGKLKETSEFKNGMRNGKTIFYSEEGNIISEKVYENEVENK